MSEELLTVEEAAARLRTGRVTVFALTGSGAIPSFKSGKRRVILSRDLDDYILKQAGHEPEAAREPVAIG